MLYCSSSLDAICAMDVYLAGKSLEAADRMRRGLRSKGCWKESLHDLRDQGLAWTVRMTGRCRAFPRGLPLYIRSCGMGP